MAGRVIHGWWRQMGSVVAGGAAAALAAWGPEIPTGGDTEAGTPATTDGTCDPAAPATLTVGTGLDAFSPWTAATPLEFGPQGGQHIYLALRETGLRVTDWSTLELVGREQGEVVLEQWARIGFLCQDGQGEALGLQVPIPDGVQEVTLELTLTDADGDVVHVQADTAFE